MINIEYSDNSLKLKPDKSDISLLNNPLHRLYLKSTLKANVEGLIYYWVEKDSDQISQLLVNLINHFKRYGIDVVIGDNCIKIIQEIREKDERFHKLQERVRRKKNNFSNKEREQIQKNLTPTFQRVLKDFQLDGVGHLSIIGNGANFSVPGSGKTSIALAYYQLLKVEKKVDAIMVIGPASCFEPWEHEFELCFGKKPQSTRISGFTKSRRNELYVLADNYELILTTYHSSIRDENQIVVV